MWDFSVPLYLFSVREFEVAERSGKMQSEFQKGGASPFPRSGVAVSVLLSLLMFGVGAVLWADLPSMIPSGKVDFDGEPTMTPRWLFVVTMPSVTLLLLPSLAFLPGSRERFQRVSGARNPWSTSSLRRVLNLFLPLLALVFAALHGAVLLREAGRETWLPIDQLVVLVLAVFLVGFGLITPLLRTGRGDGDLFARWWGRARGPVGAGIALVGVVTGVAGLLLEEPVMATGSMGLIGPVIFVGCAFPFIKGRNRENDVRSGS